MLETKTYDCLFTQRIDSNIKALINNALGNHFPSLDALWLIQRWHPHKVAWAENLTDVFFDFLKPLSRTHLLTNGEINGSAYGFEPEYTADLPDNLNLPEFPDELIFRVPKGKTASISWIERSHDVVSSSYCDKLTNEITCWHRSQRLVTAKDSDLEIKLDSRLWLINSCVIQNGELLNLAPEQAGLILYKYADQTLEEIYDQLNLTDCRVLTGCDVEFKADWMLQINQLNNTFYSEYQWGGNFSSECLTPVFRIVPDSYYFVAYQRAGEETQRGRGLTYVYDANNQNLSIYLVYDEDSYFKEWKKTHRYNSVYEEITLELPTKEWLKGDVGQTLGVIPSHDFNPYIVGSVPTVLNPYRDFRDGIWVESAKTVDDLKPYLNLTSNGSYPDLATNYTDNTASVYRKEYFIYDGIADDINIIWEPGKWQHWRRLGSWLDYFSIDHTEFLEELEQLGWGNFFVRSDLYANVNFTRGPFGKRSRYWIWDATPRTFYTIGGNPYEGINTDNLRELLSDFDGSFKFVAMVADCDLDLFSSGEVAYFNAQLSQARTKTTEWVESLTAAWVNLEDFGLDPVAILLAGGVILLQAVAIAYLLELESRVTSNLVKEEIYQISDTRTITRDLTLYKLTINSNDPKNSAISKSESLETEQIYSLTVDGLTGSRNPAVDPSYLGSAYGYAIYDKRTGGNADYLTYTLPFRQGVSALFPDGYHRATKTVALRRDFRFQQRPGRFVVKSWDDDNNYYLYRELSDSQAQAVLAEFNADPDNKPGANNHTMITLFSGENPVIIEFDRPFFDPDCDGGDIMPDSRRAIETYERLKLVSDFLGVGVDIEWEGENVSFVSKEFPDPVFVEEPQKQIPPNWSPFAYQVTQTGQTVEKGLVFEARSNLIAKDKFGKEEIRPGGVIKCHNLLQRLDLQHDDIEKMLGGQEAGGLQIPRADKTGVMTYEGQTAMIADILYMLSCLSLRIEETNINAIRTVALNQAILRALGLPVEFDKIPYATNGDQGEILVGKIPENAPTLTDLIGVILQNLGKQVAGQLSVGEVKNG